MELLQPVHFSKMVKISFSVKSIKNLIDKKCFFFKEKRNIKERRKKTRNYVCCTACFIIPCRYPVDMFTIYLSHSKI